MARIWSCGFELQSTTSLVEWDTTTGSPTISTTIKRSGQASLRCNPSATTAYISHQFKPPIESSPNDKVYIRFYLYIASAPAALTQIMIGRDTNWPVNRVGIRLNANRTLELWDEDQGVQLGSDSSALNLNQWYRIEVKFDNSDSTSAAIIAYIDGVEFARGSRFGSAAEPNLIRLGVITSATCDLYFDDVAINTGSGSFQTSLPGEGSIVHLKPNATGDNSGGTYTGATTGWECLDEVPPDEATTYVALTATSQILDVNLESSASVGIESNDTIKLVQVGARWRAASAAACTLITRIKSQSGGTLLESAAITKNTTAWHSHDDTVPRVYKLTSYTDPQTGGSWTPSLLDTTQIGIRSTDTTPNPQVTTLWALVEYQDAPPTITLNTPDNSSFSTTTPTLEFTGNDNDDISYNLQISGRTDFTVVTNTYYFDASDAGPFDPNNGWNNDANAFDGSISTYAAETVNGTSTFGYLYAEGTNAPATGDLIGNVRVRIYGTTDSMAFTSSVNATVYTDGMAEELGTATKSGDWVTNTTGWSDYVTLAKPTGGWTWAKVQSLEVKIWSEYGADAGIAAYKVEIAVDSFLLDRSSASHAGFQNTVNGSDTDPFNPNEKISFTVQSADALLAGTYYWRARGRNPLISGNYGNWSSYRTFTVTTSQTAASERAGKIRGISTATNERGGKVKGFATANSERAAKIKGYGIGTSDRGAKIKGFSTASSDRGARVRGGITTSDSRGGKIKGYATSTSERSAKIKGYATANSERAGKIKGYATSTSERSGKIKGYATITSERGVKLRGQQTATSERGAKIKGYATSTSERAGKVRGSITTTNERAAKLRGQQVASESRAGAIRGRQDGSDNRQAKLKGYAVTTNERAAKLKGFATTSAERGGKITGQGAPSISSERAAKITGGQLITYNPKIIFVEGRPAIQLSNNHYIFI